MAMILQFDNKSFEQLMPDLAQNNYGSEYNWSWVNVDRNSPRRDFSDFEIFILIQKRIFLTFSLKEFEKELFRKIKI